MKVRRNVFHSQGDSLLKFSPQNAVHAGSRNIFKAELERFPIDTGPRVMGTDRKIEFLEDSKSAVILLNDRADLRDRMAYSSF